MEGGPGRHMSIYYKRRYKRIKYHGNWCGPGWSAGKWQDSVDEDYPAIDEFDETCKKHDRAYARGENLSKADEEFYRENVGKGFKRSLAGHIVGLQGKLRSFSQKDSVSDMSKRKHRSPSLRGRLARATPATPARSRSRGRTQARAPSVRMASRSRSARRNRSVSRASSSVASGSRSVGDAGSMGKAGSRMKRVGSVSKLMKFGVSTSIEFGSVVSATECQYLGHVTCPIETMRRQLWRAIVKRMLIRAGKLNPKWDDSPRDILATDRMNVIYRDNMDTASGPFTHSVTVGALTQEGISDAFYTYFEGASSNVALVEISYRPDNGSIGASTINLNNSHVHFSCFSQLKMQNRTVNSVAADNADDVTNVPLIGRSYGGKGTGTKFLTDKDAAIPFIGHGYHGTIEKAGTSSELTEPPSPKLFSGVTEGGKENLPPGDIKTSSLVYKKTMTMMAFIALCYDNQVDGPPPGLVYRYRKFGLFKFYGFEKQIDALVYAPENAITIAYEHNLKVTLSITPGKTQITTTFIDENH